MNPHDMWRLLPHRLRRGIFDRTALALGRAAAGGSADARQGPIAVVGAFRAPTGLGEAARLLARGLAACGLDVRAIDLTAALRQPVVVDPPPWPAAEPGPGALVVVLNPPVSSYALWLVGRRIAAGKRRIGHFVWEYERLPPTWKAHAGLHHTIAVPSRFCATVFERELGRAAALLPYPAALAEHAPPASEHPRNGGFVVGFTGDLVAAAGRKNPLACVEAVALAFPGDPQVELRMILGGGGPEHPVRRAVEERAAVLGVRLTIDDRSLDAAAHAARLANCDAYLSLHRGEGFGLTVIEAMLAALPVVATGAPPMDEWLTERTGFPIRWRRTAAPSLIDMREPGDWAEPDVEHAAESLRLIRSDPIEAARRGTRAREALTMDLGAEAFAVHSAALGIG